ncbi:MAG: LysR family transcriptional regulator [Rhodospirillales bacterium]
MDRLTGYEVFVAIVERGGFSRAARSLGMSVAMVSTAHLVAGGAGGRALIEPFHARVELTADGQRFLADARAIVEAAANAEAGFGARGAPAGGTGANRCAGFDGPDLCGCRRWPHFVRKTLALHWTSAWAIEAPCLRTEGCDIVVRVGDIDGGDVR